MKKYGIGVDIGGTTVKLGIFKNDGEAIKKWEIPTRIEDAGKSILSDIADTIRIELQQLNISKDEVQGVGVGVPGPILPDGTVNCCVNLGWGRFNIEHALGDRIGLPVKAANDANIAALGEQWIGAAKGHDNVVMVTIGTGVGGGIIINGNIVSGTDGAGGEIGHIKIRDNEPDLCGCGKHGCLEQYASATGIVKEAKRKMEQTAQLSVLRSAENLTAKDIFDIAKEGDSMATLLVENLGHDLGRALSYISCIINPEVFVIGGGVSKAGNILIDTIKRHYQEDAFHASRDTEIVLATLGNDAGIYGSAKMIFN